RHRHAVQPRPIAGAEMVAVAPEGQAKALDHADGRGVASAANVPTRTIVEEALQARIEARLAHLAGRQSLVAEKEFDVGPPKRQPDRQSCVHGGDAEMPPRARRQQDTGAAGGALPRRLPFRPVAAEDGSPVCQPAIAGPRPQPRRPNRPQPSLFPQNVGDFSDAHASAPGLERWKVLPTLLWDFSPKSRFLNPRDRVASERAAVPLRPSPADAGCATSRARR